MTDIRIINHTSLEGIWADWLLLKDGMLDTREELANVVKVALLTDARADPADVLPDIDSNDLRGWWGDLEAVPLWNGWAPIGCKLWLMSRAKITPAQAQEGSTLARIEAYIRMALQPMIDQLMCTAIGVVVSRVSIERIDALVTVYRGPATEVQLQFQNLWLGIREQ